MTKPEFPQWLQAEMDKRGWKQSDLARKARINRQVIWGYLNRNKKPDDEILKKIAKAFDMTIEEIFRVVGNLPPAPQSTKDMEAFTHRFHNLTDQERKQVLDFMKWIQSQRDHNKN